MEQNMDDMNEIFSSATQGDLDVELAAAGEMLQKIAEEQGVDLNELSDDDVAELMVDLMPKAASDGGYVAEAGQGSSIPGELTFADVAVELSKRASDEQIDLSSLSREDYHAAFNAVASSMTSPDYAYEKQAEAEATSKLAEADALGRFMARAFVDEQDKIAREIAVGTKPGLADRIDAISAPMDRPKTLADRSGKGKTLAGLRPESSREKVEGVGRKLKNFSAEHAGRADEAVQRGGAKLISSLPEGLKKRLGSITAGRARAAGYGAGAAGVAAAGGLAYGAKKLYDRSKESSVEAEALELASNFLLENGIDPSTGEKVASSEAIERANEILRNAGWIS